MIRVMHCITGLNTGGAETMLCKLLEEAEPERVAHMVVSLMDRGTQGDRVDAAGAPLWTLGMRSARQSPGAILGLAGLIRQHNPDVLQGWMYHGNLAALAARVLTPRRPLLWNVRHSVDDLADEKASTARVIRLGARLSGKADAIIYNAETARRQHEALGYRSARGVVIPNGFDCERFRPSPQGRSRVRAELGVAQDELLVGLVARYHPMKDHATFVEAAASLVASRPGERIRFVMAGRGVDAANTALVSLAERCGLQDRLLLLGERGDVVDVMQSLDIACLTSAFGEGFPNVLGEAMACGVPCVTTGVGDAETVVGDTGRSVPPRAPGAVAAAIGDLIDLGPAGRAELGRRARERIERQYAINVIARRYDRLYEQTVRRAVGEERP